jgi:hypothetical protein
MRVKGEKPSECTRAEVKNMVRSKNLQGAVTLTVIEVDFYGIPEHHAFKHMICSIGE